MPVAGDEGYERLVECPYDKSHEIRMGKMQFHLERCRKNRPNNELIECPFNSTHLIPKVEEQYHTQEECIHRTNWDRFTHEVGDPNCPVKDLVPVNAATVPDGDENWDDYEAQGSVLNAIKTQVLEKNVVRMMQCESKAKRKSFRHEERSRHRDMSGNKPDSSVSDKRKPLPPKNIPVVRQDDADAIAYMSREFRTLDLNMKAKPGNYASSDTSSMCNEPPSVAPSIAESATASRPTRFVAQAPSSSRPMSSASTSSEGIRESTAMSTALSSTSRPSTASSIAASVNRASRTNQPDNTYVEEGFSQTPIPGLGRGRRGNKK